jgi:hypothetical protein
MSFINISKLTFLSLKKKIIYRTHCMPFSMTFQRINQTNTFWRHFSQNVKKRSTTDPKLLERTDGRLKDVFNHISTLIGIDCWELVNHKN